MTEPEAEAASKHLCFRKGREGMASGKKKKQATEEERTAAGYYELHSDAVNDLASADESNSPEVSEEELKKYRSKHKLRLSDGTKAVLIKMWFAGSVCFFIFWGLSAYLTATLDLMFVFGIALGVVTDILTNSILRHFARSQNANDRWMMFPQKKYYTFFLNILYAMLLLFCVDMLYNLINSVLVSVTGAAKDSVPLGVGPILFGVFYTGFDLLFIRMKQLMKQIFRDAKKSVDAQKK